MDYFLILTGNREYVEFIMVEDELIGIKYEITYKKKNEFII